jgi:hypothetical protein
MSDLSTVKCLGKLGNTGMSGQSAHPGKFLVSVRIPACTEVHNTKSGYDFSSELGIKLCIACTIECEVQVDWKSLLLMMT